MINSRRMRSGQSMIIIAVAFLGIVAFLGFAIDTGIIYLNRVWMGQAIDAAALAAGFELPDIEGACSRAVEFLAKNGYVDDDNFSFQLIFSAEPDAPGGPVDELVFDSTSVDLTEPVDCDDLSYSTEHQMSHYHIQVRGQLTLPVVFMRVLGFNTIDITNPATAKRTAQYDVALVLDVSGSMMYDSCHYFKDDTPTTYETEYACENRRSCSTPYNVMDFEGYDEVIDDGDANLDMVPDGWGISSEYSVGLTTYGANVHSGTKAVHIFQDPGDVSGLHTEGSISWKFSTEGHSDVAVYFWVKNDSAAPLDEVDEWFQLSWREQGGDPWIPIMGIEGETGGWHSVGFEQSYVRYGVMLPNGANDKPNLELQFRVFQIDSEEGVFIDDIEMQDCPLKPFIDDNRVVYNLADWDDPTCSTTIVSKDCLDSHLLPADSLGGNSRPQSVLIEQPMSDVIRGAESFVEIIRKRADDYSLPRTDKIGLASFEQRGHKIKDLTTAYEEIVSSLYTLTSGGYTNLGAGMRYGLNIVDAGRPNTTHFVVLLTDGVLNTYDYYNPTYTHEGSNCGGADPCDAALDYVNDMITMANENNVTFFTIGLGEQLVSETFTLSWPSASDSWTFTGMDVLEWIATDTHGQAYHAPTTEELEEIFEWIAEAIFVRLTL